MFRAVGFLIILWGLSNFFLAFEAFDTALVSIFQTIEVGADETRRQIEEESLRFTLQE